GGGAVGGGPPDRPARGDRPADGRAGGPPGRPHPAPGGLGPGLVTTAQPDRIATESGGSSTAPGAATVTAGSEARTSVVTPAGRGTDCVWAPTFTATETVLRSRRNQPEASSQAVRTPSIRP